MSNVSRYIPPGHIASATHMGDAYFKAHEEMVQPAQATPFKRFPKLQLMTGGLRPYEFTILCGATGTGKTTLCANWSLDFLDQNAPQFVASVETGHTDYAKRMISAEAGHDWNTGDPVHIDMLRLFNEQHLKKFNTGNAWLSLYDNRAPIESLMADLAYMVETRGTKIAIIDNLNFFLEVTSAANAVVEMDRVIHELIIFCKRVPIHIIMVMHPKKTDGGRVESEFDIKGSSTAVQEAHNVLLFNRPHPELLKAGTATPGDRELTIAKMRRRGKYVRRRLILRAINCVKYQEGDLV
jgi:archaellum biogenesis ATPase FlaH